MDTPASDMTPFPFWILGVRESIHRDRQRAADSMLVISRTGHVVKNRDGRIGPISNEDVDAIQTAFCNDATIEALCEMACAAVASRKACTTEDPASHTNKMLFAAIVAAAGNHPLLIIGGEQADRRAFARAVTAYLPPLTRKGYAALAFAHGTVGRHHPADRPPFMWTAGGRSTVEAMLGGVTSRAGAVHLAHGGTLYLDDFSKHRQNVQEAVFFGCEDSTRRMPADYWLVAGADEPVGPIVTTAAGAGTVEFEVIIRLGQRFNAGTHLYDRATDWFVTNAAATVAKVRSQGPHIGGVVETLARIGMGNGFGCSIQPSLEEEARLLGGEQ